MPSQRIDLDAVEIIRSAANLEKIAESLEADLARFDTTVGVVIPPRDEVSVAAIQAANKTASVFRIDATGGVGEIRRVAAALRVHAEAVMAADTDSAGVLRA